jgi:hypothetical protein
MFVNMKCDDCLKSMNHVFYIKSKDLECITRFEASIAGYEFLELCYWFSYDGVNKHRLRGKITYPKDICETECNNMLFGCKIVSSGKRAQFMAVMAQGVEAESERAWIRSVKITKPAKDLFVAPSRMKWDRLECSRLME